jgi:hypothetical protein
VRQGLPDPQPPFWKRSPAWITSPSPFMAVSYPARYPIGRATGKTRRPDDGTPLGAPLSTAAARGSGLA